MSVYCGLKAFIIPLFPLNIVSWIFLAFAYGIPLAIIISWGLGGLITWPIIKDKKHLPSVTYFLAVIIFIGWNIIIGTLDDPSTKIWAILYFVLYVIFSLRGIFLINKEILPKLFANQT